MPPRPQRLVRRPPFWERFKAWMNPMDVYLWLSEEIQTLDWDSKTFGTRFGLAANFLYMVVCANTRAHDAVDDVFGDGSRGSWVSFVVWSVSWTLFLVSGSNAWYTFTRNRHYRLFEANVEQPGPSTPSAHRVRVDSSPATASPLRFVQDMLVSSDSAATRSYPEKTRDVWELSIWDPFPATLRIFCLFSPGHVFVHRIYLPLEPLDPRPSVKLFKCVALQVILSAQLLFLQERFSRQAKDTAVVAKEVMHEYDTKYVHPRLHPVVREVGTQISVGGDGEIASEAFEAGTPATLTRRGFVTNPNMNYAKHFAPDGLGQQQQQPQARNRNMMAPSLLTPPNNKTGPSRVRDVLGAQQSINRSAAGRHSLPGSAPFAAKASQQLRKTSPESEAGTNVSSGTSMGGVLGMGGSLGAFTHYNSPFRKATSAGDTKDGALQSPRNSREMAALEQRGLADRMIRQSSPLKGDGAGRRATAHPGQQQVGGQDKHRWERERYPKLR